MSKNSSVTSTTLIFRPRHSLLRSCIPLTRSKVTFEAGTFFFFFYFSFFLKSAVECGERERERFKRKTERHVDDHDDKRLPSILATWRSINL